MREGEGGGLEGHEGLAVTERAVVFMVINKRMLLSAAALSGARR